MVSITADTSQSLFWYNQIIQLIAAQSKETWCLLKPGEDSHGLLDDGKVWFGLVHRSAEGAHGPLPEHCSSPSGNGSFLSHQFPTPPPVDWSTRLPPLPSSRFLPVLRTGLAEAAGNRHVLAELPSLSQEGTWVPPLCLCSCVNLLWAGADEYWLWLKELTK